jgi:large subunit ribosomal protein L32
MRRANHDRITAPQSIACPHCGDMMLPHRVCPACGHYKGKKIVDIRGKATEQATPSE